MALIHIAIRDQPILFHCLRTLRGILPPITLQGLHELDGVGLLREMRLGENPLEVLRIYVLKGDVIAIILPLDLSPARPRSAFLISLSPQARAHSRRQTHILIQTVLLNVVDLLALLVSRF